MHYNLKIIRDELEIVSGTLKIEPEFETGQHENW
jgi:hypothetical protein